MKITPPQVGRLLARNRGWSWHHVTVGTFGPAVRNGRNWYVDLAGVEQYAGRTFSAEQIAAALNPRMPVTTRQAEAANG